MITCAGQVTHVTLRSRPHVVQALARHAHVDITMAIYAHTDLDARRQALDAVEWEDL